jgi:tRNA(Ile)-lysidine synthase
MLHSLEAKLVAAWPPSDWADVTVVVAVSGGCDSVALLRAILAVRRIGAGRVCVAHLNHQLRPDADEDQQFVEELCRGLGVTCEGGRVAVERLAHQCGDGIEAAARRARYDFLRRAAGRLGARFVATAHTADDQAETILHRIIRGTGVRGLSGMSRARRLGHATLIRPLLAVHRLELQAYLDSLDQSYRHDPSNADLRFTRNRIRLQLMPQLRSEFNPGVTEALLRLGTLADEAQTVVDDLVDQLFSRCAAIEAGAARLDLAMLADQPEYLVRELLMAVWRRQGWPLQAMGQQKWEELSSLALQPEPPLRRVLPGGVMVEVAEGMMRLGGNPKFEARNTKQIQKPKSQ